MNPGDKFCCVEKKIGLPGDKLKIGDEFNEIAPDDGKDDGKEVCMGASLVDAADGSAAISSKISLLVPVAEPHGPGTDVEVVMPGKKEEKKKMDMKEEEKKEPEKMP